MQNTERKVITRLLEWAGIDSNAHGNTGVSIQFDSTKADIGTLLGVSRVDATRVLNDLKGNGIIDMQGSTIILNDRKALEARIA